MCVDSNFYRDLVAFGGVPTQLMTSFRVLAPPGVEDDRTTDPLARTIVSLATADNAYYNDFWEQLNVTTFMPGIVARDIPILSQSGWQDLFPGGNLDVEVADNVPDCRRTPTPARAGDPARRGLPPIRSGAAVAQLTHTYSRAAFQSRGWYLHILARSLRYQPVDGAGGRSRAERQGLGACQLDRARRLPWTRPTPRTRNQSKTWV